MAVRAKLIPFAVACGLAGALAAQESEEPDLISLLEFLGSWEEGDDEWLIVEGLDDDSYEVAVDDSVFDVDEADAVVARVTEDADGADETGESGESNDVDGKDEVTAIDAN